MNSVLNRGSAILDAVVAIALFAVLFTGFFALMQVGMKTVTEHKARSGALALARSHIEYIRSLDYTAVGVQGGSPSGNLLASTTKTLNNLIFTITTEVTWYDDAEDGLGGADTNPNDYKALRVNVSWPEHAGQSGSVTLLTYKADFVVE